LSIGIISSAFVQGSFILKFEWIDISIYINCWSCYRVLSYISCRWCKDV